MNPPSRTSRVLLLSLLGGALGYLLLHPYTMLVYGFYGHHGRAEGQTMPDPLFHEVISSFHPGMLHMGMPFAVFGAVAGLFIGFWFEDRRRRFEMEKKLLAVKTLRQLMMTLAHYLLNAAQVVGGFAVRDIGKEQDEVIKQHLVAIRNEAMRIEAVVKSLQSLESVRSDRFIKNSETAMVDIQKELQEKLER